MLSPLFTPVDDTIFAIPANNKGLHFCFILKTKNMYFYSIDRIIPLKICTNFQIFPIFKENLDFGYIYFNFSNQNRLLFV